MIVLLCSVSSFYYALLAGFREKLLEEMHIVNILETVFLLDCLSNFFLSYSQNPKDPKSRVLKDSKSIWNKYLKGNFWIDFVPLIPLHIIHLPYGFQSYFMCIKISRVRRGLAEFDVGQLMVVIKGAQLKQLGEKCAENE